MTVVLILCAILLSLAAAGALFRAERGPSMLDRTVALDVFATTTVAFIALEAAYSRRIDTIPVLVVLSLVGFVGSVTIARFASREPVGEGKVRSRDELAREQAARDESERAAAERAAGEPEQLRPDEPGGVTS
ncbi:monovalent cation/H+ antiporter complex subunit F [Pengzhenrongella sicca]|nr:MrpF/PhaF family protein [Pengzhenrongella sicca]